MKDEAKRQHKEEGKEQEYLENWKRERAAFLNYKKEEIKRVSQLVKFANEELILNILEILDNIYIAERKLPKNLKNNQWVEGVLNIKAQILDFLEKQGVKKIESMGKKFDPNFHEAIEEIKGKEKGIIIKEIKKGYLLHNKVIRPAKVKVSK